MIGISSNLLTTPLPDTITNQRYHLSTDYIRSVVDAEGLPIILPQLKPTDAEAIMNQLDGLILSGGLDISPTMYQTDMCSTRITYSLERDHYELALLQAAIAQNKPVLGICRGAQLINIAFGGDLILDIKDKFPESSIEHIQNNEPDEASHLVEIQENSGLHQVSQTLALKVNSYHHQVINQIGEGLIATAWSEDGLIEAIEYPTAKFLVGVQWHPEIMSITDSASRELFRTFVAATKK
ncbi:gamma-glutamyl-gamma-aminobutyrate hydrolase family protein [Carnobacterium gallinarum]|uniref:gamma-glutamyl-gamma-aminobutyrate hydrolase family protein n=1 Tax=Carnobacterium gallinarum TaxID=2749 RepID=UPI00055490DA|nr:gamma-glutamyl-gamma-aminobutyrate hydrolase family protein [Carnobacterium gallinarum]